MKTKQKQPDKIGLLSLTALVTGNLVGSGAFLVPTTLAIYGNLSLIAWLIASGGAILLSLVFAQLASHHHKTGGPYIYVKEAFGNDLGFYVCWGYWVISWIGNPAVAVAAVGYFSALFGGFTPWENFALQAITLSVITGFNLLGLSLTGRVGLIVTLLKVIPLIVLPIIGLFYIDFSLLMTHENLSGLSIGTALNGAALGAMWGFVGLETGTVPAGQVYQAEKTVPRATILGTLTAALVYSLGAVVIMCAVSQKDLLLSKAPYADAAHHIFGGTWSIPVTITAILSCLGTLNGWMLISGRIAQGAAQDNFFPSFFQRTTIHGTPHWGILASFFCAFPLLFLCLNGSLMDQFNFIIEVAVTLILLVYGLCVLAYVKLLLKSGKLTTLRGVLAAASFTFVLWAMWAASFKMVFLSLGLLVFGIPFHVHMRRGRLKSSHFHLLNGAQFDDTKQSKFNNL